MRVHLGPAILEDQFVVVWGATFAGKEAPQLDVDLTPVLVREGVGVNVYKVSMSINPAAGTRYSLHFANSATQKVIKTWGVEV